MPAKRSRKGVLRTLRSGGSTKTPKRPKPLWRRFFGWVAGGAVLALLLVTVVALGGRMLFPGARGRAGEGRFEVVDVAEGSDGATVWIVVEGRRTPIRIGEGEGIDVGDRLDVSYVALPNVGGIRVEEWTKAP